jgi:PIN domain nuclease of toxin-antitoxin system
LGIGSTLVLLGTQALLWWLTDSPELSKRARATISDTKNTLLVSAASAWEIVTEGRIGKLSVSTELTEEFC